MDFVFPPSLIKKSALSPNLSFSPPFASKSCIDTDSIKTATKTTKTLQSTADEKSDFLFSGLKRSRRHNFSETHDLYEDVIAASAKKLKPLKFFPSTPTERLLESTRLPHSSNKLYHHQPTARSLQHPSTTMGPLWCNSSCCSGMQFHREIFNHSFFVV